MYGGDHEFQIHHAHHQEIHGRSYDSMMLQLNALTKFCRPGGPTKQRIGPFNEFVNFCTAKYSSTRSFTFQDRNDRYLKSLPNEQDQLYLLLPLSTEALITNQYNCE